MLPSRSCFRLERFNFTCKDRDFGVDDVPYRLTIHIGIPVHDDVPKRRGSCGTIALARSSVLQEFVFSGLSSPANRHFIIGRSLFSVYTKT